MYATNMHRAVIDGAEDTVQYTLHGTTIVHVSACRNSAVLRTGGWITTPTVRAINDAMATLGSRWRASRIGGVLYLKHMTMGNYERFVEGMTIKLR